MTVRRQLVAASALVVAALLAGCSDDDEPGADPTEATSSASEPTTPSSTPTSTPTSTPPATESTPPATGGPVVQLRDLTVQAPEGWTVYNQIGDHQVTFDDNQPESGVIRVDDAAALPNETLEDLAGYALEDAETAGNDPRRVKNRTVAGLEGYVLVGSSQAYEKYYQWGTRTESNWVKVEFEWVIEPANADQVIEQVLASITFS